MKKILLFWTLICFSAIVFADAPKYTGAFFKMPIVKNGSVITPKISSGMNQHFLCTTSIIYANGMTYIFVILPTTENQMILAIMYGLQGLTDSEQITYADNINKLNIAVNAINNPTPTIKPTPTVIR
jgi:hypothetical protein